MVRRSIGIVLLGAALSAFLVVLLGGSSTAAFEPFSHMPYYSHVGFSPDAFPDILPATGIESGSVGGLSIWVIPTLAGIGVSSIVAFALLRFRALRR